MRALVASLLYAACAAPVPLDLARLFEGGDANATEPCVRVAARFSRFGLWEALADSLRSAASPAVQVFANAAHYALLHNFLCSLRCRAPRGR